MEKVIVTDIKMGFLSMVIFMVKFAVASIPAIIIIFILAIFCSSFLTALYKAMVLS